jgi:hypothetical protein
MRAPVQRQASRSLLLACVAGLFAGPALADPIYGLLGTIPVPANTAVNPSGKFSSYDISFFDANTQDYYIADRSNASVDVFSAATNTYVTRIGGFAGAAASTSASGPDGVLVVNGGGLHQLWAGDGNSTLKGFSIAAGHSYTPLPGSPLSTGGALRVDEMAYNPANQRLIVANNADMPPFSTLVNAASNTLGPKTVFNGAGAPAADGIEQPAYNAATGKFYVTVDTATGPGAVSEIDPNTGAVLRTFDLAAISGGAVTACGPTGLTAGPGGQMLVGCGVASQSIIIDPTKAGTGTNILVKSIKETSGADQVWYDPTTNRYFLADRNDPSGPVLGIINAATDSFLQNVPTTPGDHSVAVDPVSGKVFVPLGATVGTAVNTVCTDGCIGIYGVVGQTPVPEPGSLGLLASALAGFGGLRRVRSRKTVKPESTTKKHRNPGLPQIACR